jgi:hypothetical protein
MARKRMIDPEFWSDEDMAAVGRDARLMFIGVWNHSDDYGNLPHSPAKLKAQIFPLDDDLKVTDVERLLADLIRVGKMVEYSANGSRYLHVPDFVNPNSPYCQKISRPSARVHPPFTESSRTQGGLILKRRERKRKEVKRRVCSAERCMTPQ